MGRRKVIDLLRVRSLPSLPFPYFSTCTDSEKCWIVPHASTLPSLSAVTSRLSTALSTLTSSHSLDRSSLDHFTHERQELDQQERELRIEVEKVEEKSRWFGEFKEMVEVWAQFLDEKVYPSSALLDDLKLLLLTRTNPKMSTVSGIGKD